MIKFILSILLIFSFKSVFALDPYIRYANDVNPQDLLVIEPRLLTVMATVAEFAKQNNVKFIVTSIIRDEKRNKAAGAISNTHVEGRAFDFSTRSKWGWNKKLLDKLVNLVESRHGEYGIYGQNRKQKVILVHAVKGGATHGHCQVVSKYDFGWEMNTKMKMMMEGIGF